MSFENVDDGWTTDACLYYKLINNTGSVIKTCHQDKPIRFRWWQTRPPRYLLLLSDSVFDFKPHLHGHWRVTSLDWGIILKSVVMEENMFFITFYNFSVISQQSQMTITNYMSRDVKTNKMAVRPAKTQISLGICPVWSESSLSTWRKIGSLATQWAHSEDSKQTGRMLGLRWVHTHFVGFVMLWLIY